MKEAATVKQLITDKVRQLAALVHDSDRHQATVLEKEILQLLSQHMSQDAAPVVVKGRSGADSVERCPVCMIRSLRPILDTQSVVTGNHGAARRYRCSSCGHEEWRAS